MAGNDLNSVVSRLKSDLGSEQQANKQLVIGGGIVVVVLLGYLAWVTSMVQQFLEPESLAYASAGAAVDVAPTVSGHLRVVVVDGAPDMARMASDAVVNLIPNYREILEMELRPVVDEVCVILAQTAASQMLKSNFDGAIGQREGLQGAANAVVNRLDATLEGAMDEPMEMDGPTPRQMIDSTLSQLRTVDRGLKQLASNRGTPEEKELILAWLNVLTQFQADRDTADQEAYKEQNSGNASTATPTPPADKAEGEAAPKKAAKAVKAKGSKGGAKSKSGGKSSGAAKSATPAAAPAKAGKAGKAGKAKGR